MAYDAVYLSSKNLVLVFGCERTEAGDGKLAVLSDIMVLDTVLSVVPTRNLWRTSISKKRSNLHCYWKRGCGFGGRTGRNRRSTVHMLDTGEQEINDG